MDAYHKPYNDNHTIALSIVGPYLSLSFVWVLIWSFRMGNIFDCAANPLGPLPGDEDQQGASGETRAPGSPHHDPQFGKDAEGNPLYPVDPKHPKTRLSESLLWKLQRNFYDSKGTQPWKDGIVPNFVTSNAYIASAYAKVIMGLLRDIYVHHTVGNATEPLYIIETGAGHGKLAYLIIESLLRWEEHLPKLGGSPPFVYVLTETGQKPIDEWKDHVSLRPLFEKEDSIELLDFALFDVTKDDHVCCLGCCFSVNSVFVPLLELLLCRKIIKSCVLTCRFT